MTLGHVLDGPADAPVLVLSPSLGTTTALWEAALPALAGEHRVLRHDHPGHGRSPLPDGPVTVASIGAALVDLLDELGIEHASVCGVSLGGMVAMWLGANAPERVDRLVLACTGARLGTAEQYHARARLVREQGTAAVVDLARERWFAPAFREAPQAARILDELRALPREGYAACCEAVAEFDFRAELPRVAPPTLVLHGAEDAVTPPEVVATLVDGIPDARAVEIRRAAHLAVVERPQAFAAAVLDHLREGP